MGQNELKQEIKNTEKTACKDCEAVKKEIKKMHSNSKQRKRKSKKIKIIAGKLRMRMMQAFPYCYKQKPYYSLCLNWH